MFLYVVHLLIVILLLSIPLWPLPVLKYGVFIPLALPVIWLLFNGCPISQAQPELEGGGFIHHLINKITPMDSNQVSHLMTVVLVAIVTIVYVRSNKCEYK